MSENSNEFPMVTFRIILVSLTVMFAIFGFLGQKVLEAMNPSFEYQAFLEIDKENAISFQIEKNALHNYLSIFNGTEEIKVHDFTLTKDSLIFTMPIFYSQVKAKIVEDHLEGLWWKNPESSDYTMPFYAYEADKIPTQFDQTPLSTTNKTDFTGKWESTFSPNTEDQYPAIGEFKHGENNRLTGTFMTETGDYRFLAGKSKGDEFYLSCFDGSHAFLFKGKKEGEEIKGTFWSGKHWQEPFVAIQNDSITLGNPYELTYLKEDHQLVDFVFPNLQGDSIKMSDKQFKDKNLVIQIFGSWCPNCMDETALYTELHKKYKKNVEFIGVAFEIKGTLEEDKAILEKYIKHFDIQYPILYGGKASKKLASEQFSMLNKIISFPTTIVLNREREIVKIHTGFNGPATSVYQSYLEEFENLLKQLAKK